MMRDNYSLSRDRAQKYFLGFDQEKIIKDRSLSHNESRLFVEFLGRPYQICRKSGLVVRAWDGTEAGYEETLSIFDLLCHEGTERFICGTYATVNSLRGGAGAIGVGTHFYGKAAQFFDGDPEGFCRACESLGGKPVKMADLAFSFPVFGELSVILKFYHSDDEFPAALTLLWDKNSLQFMYYETVFYVAAVLLSAVRKEMEGGREKEA